MNKKHTLKVLYSVICGVAAAAEQYDIRIYYNVYNNIILCGIYTVCIPKKYIWY